MTRFSTHAFQVYIWNDLSQILQISLEDFSWHKPEDIQKIRRNNRHCGKKILHKCFCFLFLWLVAAATRIPDIWEYDTKKNFDFTETNVKHRQVKIYTISIPWQENHCCHQLEFFFISLSTLITYICNFVYNCHCGYLSVYRQMSI